MTYLGGSVAVLAADRNTWTSRANNAWGASRQWNVGSSFETDSANNAAAASTWQSRANSAWGASRVWSSGESWEAAYNRVLPPASVVVLSGNTSGNGSSFNLTTDRSGQWVVVLRTGNFDASPNYTSGGFVNVGGNQVIWTQCRASSAGMGAGNWWQGYIASGTAIYTQIWADGQNPYGYTSAYFIPTQQYPH